MRTEAFFTPPDRFACPAFGHSRPASAIAGVKERKEVKEMNTLVIVLIAAVCLLGAYTLYGRWLANKWGIDPTAKTPAVVHEDGRDYVPTNGWTVFAHQFSSIAGAGPVTGAIQAAAFGRHLLRRCHRLRRSVRFRQERRQEHGHADREVHRQDRPQAVPAVLLAVLHHRHRRLHRHGLQDVHVHPGR